MLRQTSFITLVAALAGVFAAGSASAQSKTWLFPDGTSPGSCGLSSTPGNSNPATGNVGSCSEQPGGTTTTLQVTAWTGSSSANYIAAAVTPQGGNGYGAGQYLSDTSSVDEWDPSLTPDNYRTTGGDHAVDNGTGGTVDANSYTDALLLKFTSGAEALTHVTVGWTGTDGDFQILRWVGTNPGTDAGLFTGRNTTNLVSGSPGWQLVGQVGLAGGIDATDATVSDFNNNKLTSSYWLLSAYNAGFGSTVSGTRNDSGLGTGSTDALKFVGVGTTTPGSVVPEPTSLALVGAALLGGFAARRRQQGRATA